MVSPSAGAVEQCVRNHTVHYKGTNNIHICLSSQTYMKSYVISFYSNCTIFRSYMFRTQNTGQVPGFVLEQVGPGKYFQCGSRRNKSYSKSNLACNGICVGRRVTVSCPRRLPVLVPLMCLTPLHVHSEQITCFLAVQELFQCMVCLMQLRRVG